MDRGVDCHQISKARAQRQILCVGLQGLVTELLCQPQRAKRNVDADQQRRLLAKCCLDVAGTTPDVDDNFPRPVSGRRQPSRPEIFVAMDMFKIGLGPFYVLEITLVGEQARRTAHQFDGSYSVNPS